MIDLSIYRKPTDRGAPRWKEALWIAVRAVFFLPSIPFPSDLRAGLLRMFGASIGRDVAIRSGVNISMPWRMEIGDSVWIGEGVRILSLAKVCVGSHVCISQEVFLCTGSHDFSKDEFTLVTGDIRIEDHCWLAARVFVSPGVTVGEGSVVGANSTVLRDVAPRCFVAGNPARVIRDLSHANG